MWFKVDDEFLDHPKVMMAARILGGAKHIGRVASVWLEAGLYASKYLTDGFVPAVCVQTFKTDNRAEDVMNACASAKLFRSGTLGDEPGYFFHDWQHHNPAAEEVKRKRAEDRARKAAQKALKNGRHVHGMSSEDIKTVFGFIVESERNPQRLLPESSARARERDPVPVPEDQDQTPRDVRRAPPARMELTSLKAVRRHLRRAVHGFIESRDPQFLDERTGVLLPGRLVDELKPIASALRAEWRHGLDLTRIVASVIGARERRDRRRARRVR